MDMKKIIIILACMAAFVSCKTKIAPEVRTELSAEPAEIIVTAADTYASFNIVSNASWQVECVSAVPTLDKDNWLSGFTKYGVNDGLVEVEFTENHERNVTRTATFSVYAKDKAITLTLTQRPVDFVAELTVAEPERQVDYNVKKVEFEVKSNVPWSVSSDSDWVRSYTRTGNEDGTITVEFDYNPETISREASLTVNSEAGETVLKITQGGGPAPEAAVDVTAAEFVAAPESSSELYRLSGIIENMVSSTYGSMRIKDATGSAFVYCLLPEKDGQEATFSKLGLGVGDYIVMVGHKRVSTVGGLRADELVDGYQESHKTVGTLSIEDYNRLPDGKVNWYRLKGEVTSISDNVNGSFTMDDGTGTVEVKSLLTGVNGESGKFSELGIGAGSRITVIAAEKADGSVAVAYYEKSKDPALEPGVIARWNFTPDAVTAAGSDMTWTGSKMDAAGKKDASEYDNSEGDGGRYIDSGEGSGRMTFVQSDKTALDPDGDISRRIMYYSGQPGAHGLAMDDCFLFAVNAGMTVPAGTRLKFSFCVRPEAGGAGYFMVEYLNGDEWKPVAGLTRSSIDGYTYNLRRETSEQTLTECNIVTEQDMDAISVRIRVSAPYLANGNRFDGLASGGVRFRGLVSGNDLSPVMEAL